ncbi:MAG TPA: FlgO family outer membrane protein [Ignavibacteriaceae bacterium]|nr:FlgO family outer membrane protein [Ignavibacteriaceae bacterium]
MIGENILHYKIIEKLGQGGMGIVYLALDTKLDRKVAIKFLPNSISVSPEEKERFKIEARASAALSHPNIATIYAIEECDGKTFIVMEYINGVELKEKINKGLLPLSEVTSVAYQIAEGLEASHKAGVVHRDIKSQNIMITNDGKVKIMDFGLAKIKGGSQVTKVGATVGTVSYMAPEQMQGENVDARADIFSFGVIIFELLTGKMPFRGEHEAAIMYSIQNEEPLSIQDLRPEVPQSMVKIILKMLEKDPQKRYKGALEFVNDLSKSQQTLSVQRRDEKNQKKSIAVMYFENMSSEKESDYFCAGITEDIITDLSKIKELKVVPRTDVLIFRNKETNTSQIADTLQVDYILEGSIRKSGNKMRINAQLLSVENGSHIWAERFDRNVDDIFELQNEISQKIFQALKVSLTETEKESLQENPTNNLRAYDVYMRGRELISLRGRKNNEEAIKMLEEAVLMDPDFASAYAALAEAYSYMYEWYDGKTIWLEKSIQSNQKALELDPSSVEARFGIAMVYFYQKRLKESQLELEAIIEVNPKFYPAYIRLGLISELSNEIDSAIRYYQIASGLKPHDEESWIHLDSVFRRKADYKSAVEASTRVIEITAQKLEASQEDLVVMSRLAMAYAWFGGKEECKAMLKKLFEIDTNDGLVLYYCSCTYALLNEREKAIISLRRAFDAGFKGLSNWANSEAAFDSLRNDIEFKELIARSE